MQSLCVCGWVGVGFFFLFRVVLRQTNTQIEPYVWAINELRGSEKRHVK